MDLLFHAVNNNDLLQLQEVFHDYPDLDVNEPLIGSMTALHVAAEKGYCSCVTVLISAGADINAPDEFGYTALMTSIMAGFPRVTQKLLRTPGVDLEQASRHGLTAMHIAVKSASPNAVNMLLQAGARVSLQGRSSLTALELAVMTRQEGVVDAMLYGPRHLDPNTLLVRSDSPLYACLLQKDLTVAWALVRLGYEGSSEIQRYKAHLAGDLGPSSQNKDSDPQRLHDKERMLAIVSYATNPPELQHQCRLFVRRALGYNIWCKIQGLGLPQKIQDYVCFRDIYNHKPLITDTGDVVDWP